MTHHERKMEARHETAPGSLERMAFSVENDGEKSLLTLIEEHRPRQSETQTETSSNTGWSASASPPDDVDDEEGYRRDHLMMRLGGNGF